MKICKRCGYTRDDTIREVREWLKECKDDTSDANWKMRYQIIIEEFDKKFGVI